MKLIKNIYLKWRKAPNTSVYEIVGKEEGVRRLVDEFYSLMENSSQAKNALHAHQNGITKDVKDKLFEFLSGWFGGPNLFMEKHGHPRMRMRHMPFKISEKERSEWLWCMENALKTHRPKISKSRRKIMMGSFTALAMRIQNR